MSELYFEIKENMYQVLNKDSLSEPKKMHELLIHKNYYIEDDLELLKEVSSDLEETNNMVKKRIKRLGGNFEK